jgi:hypothetical protein
MDAATEKKSQWFGKGVDRCREGWSTDRLRSEDASKGDKQTQTIRNKRNRIFKYKRHTKACLKSKMIVT